MKTCSSCKIDKLFTEFYKSKNTKTGYQAYCKDCCKQRSGYLVNYRQQNREELVRKQREAWLKNKDNHNAKQREYYLENREILREKGKLHYENNKSTYLHYSKKRKLLIAKAMPKWLTKEMQNSIKSFYIEAKKLTLSEGTVYHVDHIVPLNGENVCGLHVPWNLQIITAEENLKKSNKYE